MSLTYVHSERGFWRRALQLSAYFPCHRLNVDRAYWMFGASAMVSVWAAGFFVVGRDLKSVIGDSDISSIAGHVAAFFSGRDNYSTLLSRDLNEQTGCEVRRLEKMISVIFLS